MTIIVSGNSVGDGYTIIEGTKTIESIKLISLYWLFSEDGMPGSTEDEISMRDYNRDLLKKYVEKFYKENVNKEYWSAVEFILKHISERKDEERKALASLGEGMSARLKDWLNVARDSFSIINIDDEISRIEHMQLKGQE